jgi:hypothetical protein
LSSIAKGVVVAQPDRNWVTRFTYKWVNQLGAYRLTGTVKPTLACASR